MATLLLLSISFYSSKKSIPSFDACAYKKFLLITVNNKSNHNAVAMVKEKKITANVAWKTIELFYYESFIFCKFQLNIFCAPSLLPKTTNAIGNWYSQLLL